MNATLSLRRSSRNSNGSPSRRTMTVAAGMKIQTHSPRALRARKTIVEGAVAIVHDAVDRLRAAGMELAPAQKEVLISNLLVVLCSGSHAQPVLQVQASQKT